MEVLDLQRPLLGQPQKAKATDERPSLPKAAPPGEGSLLPFTPPPHYFIPGHVLAVSGQILLHPSSKWGMECLAPTW